MIPEIWHEFCAGVLPGNLNQTISPICFSPRSDMNLHAVEWKPGGHRSIISMKFGIKSFRACARHSLVGGIAVAEGIPVWNPDIPATLVCYPGETERDLRDFTFFASNNNFAIWIFVWPSRINISYSDVSLWDTMERADSAMLGDVMASRWIVLAHGGFEIPELDSGYRRRPLGAIGMRCREMGISLECTDRQIKRINPVTDSVGQFALPIGENNRKVMTDDSHIPGLAITKSRDPQRVCPARLGGGGPLSSR